MVGHKGLFFVTDTKIPAAVPLNPPHLYQQNLQKMTIFAGQNAGILCGYPGGYKGFWQCQLLISTPVLEFLKLVEIQGL